MFHEINMLYEGRLHVKLHDRQDAMEGALMLPKFRHTCLKAFAYTGTSDLAIACNLPFSRPRPRLVHLFSQCPDIWNSAFTREADYGSEDEKHSLLTLAVGLILLWGIFLQFMARRPVQRPIDTPNEAP